MTKTQVIRTFLEMDSPAALRGGEVAEPGVRVDRVENPTPQLYRDLYVEVGRDYHWVDRLPWSREQIAQHLGQAGLEIWVMSCEGERAGYFELNRRDGGAIDIAYFGLLPAFHGRGLGRHLLTVACERAWALGAKKVTLNTCTLDNPAALPNYLRRGFKVVREEKYWIETQGTRNREGGASRNS
jgi:ribosomal protein S18 acetylase RimI-like enzyme